MPQIFLLNFDAGSDGARYRSIAAHNPYLFSGGDDKDAAYARVCNAAREDDVLAICHLTQVSVADFANVVCVGGTTIPDRLNLLFFSGGGIPTLSLSELGTLAEGQTWICPLGSTGAFPQAIVDATAAFVAGRFRSFVKGWIAGRQQNEWAARLVQEAEILCPNGTPSDVDGVAVFRAEASVKAAAGVLLRALNGTGDARTQIEAFKSALASAVT
jgi:hypothetical protein